ISTMTHQARTNVYAVAKDQSNKELADGYAHAYDTTYMAVPTFGTTTTLPLRPSLDFTSQLNEDGEHDSLSLEPQPGYYDKSEQSTILDDDEFPSSSVTEDSF